MEAFQISLTTLEGTKIELSKLSGKLIILRFELFFLPLAKKQEIQGQRENKCLENKKCGQLLSYFNVPKLMFRKVLTSRNRILDWLQTDKILLTNLRYIAFSSTY
jgi:hypothetical protein